MIYKLLNYLLLKTTFTLENEIFLCFPLCCYKFSFANGDS